MNSSSSHYDEEAVQREIEDKRPQRGMGKYNRKRAEEMGRRQLQEV